MTTAGTTTGATTRAATDVRAARTERRVLEDNATVSVGMAVALGALAMTFAAILLAYAIVRVQAASWPPPGEKGPPPIWPWPLAATVVALAGSGAMAWSRRIHAGLTKTLSGRDEPRRLSRALATTAACGVAFVAIQVTGWSWLWRSDFRPSGGLVASVVFALTIFHALHAVGALIVLAPPLARAVQCSPIRGSALAAVSSFWHLVTVVWLVVFLAVFVA